MYSLLRDHDNWFVVWCIFFSFMHIYLFGLDRQTTMSSHMGSVFSLDLPTEPLKITLINFTARFKIVWRVQFLSRSVQHTLFANIRNTKLLWLVPLSLRYCGTIGLPSKCKAYIVHKTQDFVYGSWCSDHCMIWCVFLVIWYVCHWHGSATAIALS